MDKMTYHQLSTKLGYFHNRLKHALSDIEFEDLMVSTDKFNEISSGYRDCEELYKKYSHLSSNSRVNLTESEKILFTHIEQIVKELDL